MFASIFAATEFYFKAIRHVLDQRFLVEEDSSSFLGKQ